MSAVVDVGDAIELTFSTLTGATVTVTWLDPDQVSVLDQVPVAEDPTGSAAFPYTFVVTSSGVWTAEFRASGITAAVERYYVRASALSGPPPFAAVGDVSAQFGSMTPAQESLAGWLLRAASSLIRSRVPIIDEQLVSGHVSREMAALAVTNMVLRVMRNPNGLRSETTGPFSRAFDPDAASGMLQLTEADLELLIPPAAGYGSRSKVGTVRVAGGMVPPAHRRGWRHGPMFGPGGQ